MQLKVAGFAYPGYEIFSRHTLLQQQSKSAPALQAITQFYWHTLLQPTLQFSPKMPYLHHAANERSIQRRFPKG